MQIYADYAATTPLRKCALRAMLPYLETLCGNPSSLHAAGQRAARALTDARERVAATLNASPAEITFTSGGSEADNQALRSAAYLGAKEGKKHIVSTAFEHHAVLRTLDALRREGFDVTLVNVPEDGIVRVEDVAAALREDTCLVSVMYANNEIGTIQPVAELGALCRARGVLFHTDAVQAAGHLPVDVRAQKIDLLSLSAHKFGGPRGVGALYARRGVRLASLIEGGAQERGKRAGTEDVASIVGMAAALEAASAEREAAAARLIPLRDRLIAGLSAIDGAMLNGDPRRRLPNNVNFCFAGVEGATLVLLLDQKGVCASSGSACAAGAPDPSHVLLAIGRPHTLALGSLRLTLGDDATEAEIDYLIGAVRESVEKLRCLALRPLISACKNK